VRRYKEGTLFESSWRIDLTTCTDDEIKAFFDRGTKAWNGRLASTENVFEASIGGTRDFCAKILEEGETKTTAIGGKEIEFAFHPKGSIESYAKLVIRYFDISQKAIAEGDAASAARFAFNAGRIFELMRLKFGFERDAERGQKVVQGARQSTILNNAIHKEPREQRMKRMAELLVTMSITNAAYQCEFEGLGRAGAIRVQWYRHKKKL
jgi:hypothetical protein